MKYKSQLEELSNYIEQEKLKNPTFIIKDQNITIRSRLLNSQIVSDIVFIILILFFIKENIGSAYAGIGFLLLLIFFILF